MSKPAKKRRFTRRGLLKGAGIAAAGLTVTYFIGRRYFPILPSLSTPEIQASAWITVGSDGKISMLSPVHEMGQGSSLGLAQIVAEELNVDAGEIAVSFPSTGDVPHMRFTTGSQGIALHARPVAEAAAGLREELRRRAAEVVGLDKGALKDAPGGFAASGDRIVGYAEVVGDTGIALGVDSLPDARPYTFDTSRRKRQIGQDGLQVQAREIVTGGTVFTGDIRRPNMAYGRTVQTPAPDAEIVRVDTGDAEAMTGVVEVIIDKPRGLVGVVAETPGALDRAMEKIKVTWDRPEPFSAEDLAARIDVDAALSGDGLEHAIVGDDIDMAPAWDIDLRIDLPTLHHAAQEPRSAVAEFSRRDGKEVVDVWTGTQDMFVNQKKAAADLGWSPDRVTVHGMRVGGGFGGRVLYDVVREAVFLAQNVHRPVKVEWSRRDEFFADRTRTPSSHRIRIRTDREGKITDWQHGCVSGYVLFTELMAPQPVLSGIRLATHDFGAARELEAPYRAIRRRIEMSDVALPFHTGEWRSLSAAPNNFVIECAVDELARKLGADPVDFRLQNLGPEQARLKACLEKVRAMCSARPRPDTAGFGRGYACGIFSENSFVAAAFDVVIAHDSGAIRADRCYVALDAGLAINPDQIRAQVEGCAMMAIGQVLMEAAPIAGGGLAAAGFRDYPTPTMEHAPDFEIEILGDGSVPPASVGEVPILATVPALANAIRDATSFRALKLPVSFEELARSAAS